MDKFIKKEEKKRKEVEIENFKFKGEIRKIVEYDV